MTTYFNYGKKIKKFQAWDWIKIDDDTIAVKLRETNNLIKFMNGELYTDLQIENTTVDETFEVWITTGSVTTWWGRPVDWHILVAKTTDQDKLSVILFGDDGKVYVTHNPNDPDSYIDLTSWDVDIDKIIEEIEERLEEMLEDSFVKIQSTVGQTENNANMLKDIAISGDDESVTIEKTRRDLRGENSSDIVNDVNFPVADDEHAGIITAWKFTQIWSNTEKILHLEGLGGYLGVYPTIQDRPTNISDFPNLEPKPKDFIKIAEDENFAGVVSEYAITSIDENTGDITWDEWLASIQRQNYRIYPTISERSLDLNVFDGLFCYVQAEGKLYKYNATTSNWDEYLVWEWLSYFTQAQYNALTNKEKNNPNKHYIIYTEEEEPSIEWYEHSTLTRTEHDGQKRLTRITEIDSTTDEPTGNYITLDWTSLWENSSERYVVISEYEQDVKVAEHKAYYDENGNPTKIEYDI